MKQYIENFRKIYEHGTDRTDRTGVGRRSIFGVDMRFDLNDGFPLVTTRFIPSRVVVQETLFFIAGMTNVQYLIDNKANIWKPWAVKESDIDAFVQKHGKDDQALKDILKTDLMERHLNSIGPMYGAMWRNAPQDKVHTLWPVVDLSDIPSDKLRVYKREYDELKFLHGDQMDMTFEHFAQQSYRHTVDQLNDLVINLKKRPFSSRHVVTAWVPAFIPFEELSPQENVLLERGALAPCHMSFQCFVSPPKVEGGKLRLSLKMEQRSLDYPVGGNFNIAQYSLLLAMLAHVTDMEAYEFIWSTGDTHIYLDQLPLVEEQLSREPLALPTLWLNPEVKSLFDFKAQDIEIRNYVHHPHIAYPVAM